MPVPHLQFLGSYLQLPQGTQVRFGSDFNGVSDDLEANIVYNNNPFDPGLGPGFEILHRFRRVENGPGAITNAWFSMRGNVMVKLLPPG